MTFEDHPLTDFGLSVSAWPVAVVIASSYFLLTALYRLYFSPLAAIPGPAAAALTHVYSMYHDIVRGGQYIWEVDEMHKRYGQHASV